jgi:hypothetical protein
MVCPLMKFGRMPLLFKYYCSFRHHHNRSKLKRAVPSSQCRQKRIASATVGENHMGGTQSKYQQRVDVGLTQSRTKAQECCCVRHLDLLPEAGTCPEGGKIESLEPVT